MSFGKSYFVTWRQTVITFSIVSVCTTDKRTDACSRPVCIYTQILAYKKKDIILCYVMLPYFLSKILGYIQNIWVKSYDPLCSLLCCLMISWAKSYALLCSANDDMNKRVKSYDLLCWYHLWTQSYDPLWNWPCPYFKMLKTMNSVLSEKLKF